MDKNHEQIEFGVVPEQNDVVSNSEIVSASSANSNGEEMIGNLSGQDGKQTDGNDKGKKKKKIIFVVLIVVLLLGIGGSFAFVTYQKKNIDQEEVGTKDKQDEDQENDNSQVPFGKPYSLRVYGISYNDDNLFMLCGSQDEYSYCNEEAFVIPVETEDAKILAYAYDNYVLYQDDKVYLYNDDNGKSLEVDIDDDASKYTLNTFSSGYVRYLDNEDKEVKEVYGITFIKDGKSTYFNLDTEKKLYENKYNNINAIDGELLTGFDEDSEKIYLLDANKNKVYLSADTPCGYFSKVYRGDEYFVVAELGCVGENIISVYSSDYKTIVESVSSPYYEFGKNGHLFVGNKENNMIKEYDHTGKVVNSYSETSEILSVHEDLYIIKKNNVVYIKEYSGMEYKLLDWKEEYFYHSMLSRYYEADELNNENEKNPGYYFIFEYDSFGEGPGIEFYFNPVTKEIKSWELKEIGGYAKPVLYLYPEKETKVTVEFEHEESLTTTYPKFGDKWEVIASPNGDLRDSTGKYYYGLYWEENSNHRVDFSSGFYVTKDNAIEFLEKKLSFIGLNDKERNEFIMYWLPILEKNEQSIVYFELTEEREAFNKLEITPKPDSLLRVAIHVKKVDREVSIKEQKLIPFKRTGFSAVEWGGILYN